MSAKAGSRQYHWAKPRQPAQAGAAFRRRYAPRAQIPASPGRARDPRHSAPMTWSILARDDTGAFGVAIASRFFAVGALCPHARSGVGALATQALVNPRYAAPGLDLLARGHAGRRGRAPADRRRRRPRIAPAARDRRAQGRIAAHTGAACIDWCGHVAGDGYSIAGNMLAGPQVLRETARGLRARAPDCRSRSGCSPRSTPAMPPAATSAASRRRRC